MTSRLSIQIELKAGEEIETIARWWASNRPAAPTLFLDELEHAYELIRSQPQLGQPARASRIQGVRRVALRRSRYYVYYRIANDESAVVVLSVWHTSRGLDPAV